MIYVWYMYYIRLVCLIYIIFNISIYIYIYLTYMLPGKQYVQWVQRSWEVVHQLNQHTIIQQYINASGEIILENQTHTRALESTHTPTVLWSLEMGK